MKSILSGWKGSLSLAAALLLAGCGGGGGGEPAAAVDPGASVSGIPAAASTSSAAALAFVRSLAASSDSGAEPIALGDAVLATSETDEPDPGI